jgi:hypothetical protein
MAIEFLDPVSVVCTMDWQDLTVAPAVGKMQRWSAVQAANVGAAADAISLRLTNGVATINRYASHPVTWNDRDDAPELIPEIELRAGWKIQVKGGAVGRLEVSAINGRQVDEADVA